MIGCGKKAKWEINYGPSPDDFTHACEKHVGELLEEGKINTVSLFHESDWTSGPLCRCCYIGRLGQWILKLRSLFKETT